MARLLDLWGVLVVFQLTQKSLYVLIFAIVTVF
jgi:hypothetical protein